MSGGETSKSTNQPTTTKKQHASHRKQKADSPPPSIRNKRITKGTRPLDKDHGRNKVGPLSSSEPSTPKRIKKKDQAEIKNPTRERDTKLHARSLEHFTDHLRVDNSVSSEDEDHIQHQIKPRKNAKKKGPHLIPYLCLLKKQLAK